MDALEKLQARVAELDALIPVRERELKSLQAELETLRNDQLSFRRSLAYVKNEAPSETPTAPPQAKPASSAVSRHRAPRKQIKNYRGTYQKGAYKAPGIETNLGRAIYIIRSEADGITMADLIQKSAAYGKPLVVSSIGSQLSEMIKRGVIQKIGDRYVAAQ